MVSENIALDAEKGFSRIPKVGVCCFFDWLLQMF